MLLQTYIVPLWWHALQCGLWELYIPYVCLLHSLALLYGYLDIGWYGCNENNLIVMLHGDGHFVWLTRLWRYRTRCFLAFLCTLVGLQILFHFLLIYDQRIATFISNYNGDLYAMVVLKVAYYHPIWILHYSLLVAR